MDIWIPFILARSLGTVPSPVLYHQQADKPAGWRYNGLVNQQQMLHIFFRHKKKNRGLFTISIKHFLEFTSIILGMLECQQIVGGDGFALIPISFASVLFYSIPLDSIRITSGRRFSPCAGIPKRIRYHPSSFVFPCACARFPAGPSRPAGQKDEPGIAGRSKPRNR